jgi:hypothetical protein
MKQKLLQAMFAVLLIANANAQVNSGSNGSDGAFNPTTNIVINMADHPNGIYQYTSVNISNGVTVTFIPNANNTPVTWLVQGSVIINGTVDVSGNGVATWDNPIGGNGGPGGYGGGNASNGGNPSGGGPGGGISGAAGSFATVGTGSVSNTYGNNFLIPLIGGSGGGASSGEGGGGGGGALLVASSGSITINGGIYANGGGSGNDHSGYGYCCPGGGGSGGAIRIVALKIAGTGGVGASGGVGGFTGSYSLIGGSGRVRFDTYENDFTGGIGGAFTQGSQFIIIPTAGQLPQLAVTSVGGVPVSASPTGVLSTPDAVLSAQQNNPIPIVVSCANLPLNTQITVSVKPANGATVSATGLNSTGTLSSSTATISIVMPRGGGLIYAIAATSN